MNIIALDASLSCIGMCLARDTQYLYSTQYRPNGKDACDRIINASLWFGEWISCSDIHCLVYEYPSGNHGNMDINLKLGGLMYSILARFRLMPYLLEKPRGMEIFVRPKEVKSTGVYKGQLEMASVYKRFEPIHKKDGTINKAAMDRQDNEIDAIGIWLAGLKRLEGE